MKDKKSCSMGGCPCSKMHSYVYSAVRIIIGLMIAYIGLGKFMKGMATGGFMGLPVWLSFTVASIELVGGLLIALGLFTRYATIPTTIVMLTALFGFHMRADGFGAILGSGERALLYAVIFILIHIKGGGKYSIDHLMCKKKE